MADPHAFAPGTLIASKYRVVRELGRGGFGLVLEVEHRWTGRRLALKIVSAATEDDDALHRRFLREARTAGRLVHPHVVAVVDADREPLTGHLFLVQELLEGEDLAALLVREKTLSFARAASILLPIMDALSAAHAAGVIHRDVKPSNIFLAGGGALPKLIDFGLSKSLTEPDITAMGQTPGTPHYMSPEHLMSPAEVDAASDVWSMGVVWYEVLSGRMPFDARELPRLVSKICGDRARSLRDLVPALPEPVARAIDLALLRERSLRFPSIDALRSALTTARGDALPSAQGVIDEGTAGDADREGAHPSRDSLRSHHASHRESAVGTRVRFGLVATNDRAEDPALAADLARLLGATPVVLKHARYADLLDALRRGTVDVAWLSPVAFIHALKEKIGVGLASVVRSGERSYRGALVGHRDRASTLDGVALAGKRVAWVDAWSAAGYLAPRRLIRSKGLDPKQLFASEVQLGSYDAIASALRSGHVDVGPTLARIDDAGEVTGHHLEHEPWAVLLGVTESIPSDVLCARAGLPKAEIERLSRTLRGVRLAEGDSVSLLMNCSTFGDIDERRYAVMSFAMD
jgi:eukaryotic-like serine/threonine-protein kinase